MIFLCNTCSYSISVLVYDVEPHSHTLAILHIYWSNLLVLASLSAVG